MSGTMKDIDSEERYVLDVIEAPESVIQWAVENIREDPNTMEQKIEEFRDMIFSRGECTPHRTDDSFLLRFLRGRNYSLEAAHNLIVSYYDFKENNPEFYEDAGFDLLEKIGYYDLISIPPYREQTGRRMMIHKIAKWDPEHFDIDDIFKATLVILELAILEPIAQIKGGICIFDLKDLTMNQAWHLNPTLAYKIFQVMVTSFPMKIQAVHVVNQPWMFGMIYNFFKPLLNERINERIFFHGNDMESLHQHISPKHLPEEYGGVHKNYDYQKWLDWFESSDIIVREMKSAGYTPFRTKKLK